MTGGAESATDSDDVGHATGELVAGKYTLLHPLDAALDTWLARCEDGPAAKAIFALQLLRFPPSRVDAQAAFEVELRKVEALAHPNLLCPLDHGANGDRELYVGYEWLKARTLAQTLRDEWPLSDARVVSIMTQLLAALAAVHEAGLAHGDVKPSNLLLVPATAGPQAHVTTEDTQDTQDTEATKVTRGAAGERVLLRGLGLAEFSPYRCAEAPPEELTEIMAEWVVGDPDYAAPEQLAGELPSARSDVYAAGVLLFQLLTRTVPFTALSVHEVAFMQRFAPPEPPSAYALVNPTLEAICLRALSKTPDLRFQSAREMHDALACALEEPDPATSGTGLALERARAQLARVSSVALAPALRVSSTALAPVARAGSAALERARVHVARISGVAIAPVTRHGRHGGGGEGATSTPAFRADALSAAPVETAVGQRRQRGFTPLLALALLGVIVSAVWWLEQDDLDAEALPTAAAPGLPDDEWRRTLVMQDPSELIRPDSDPAANADPSLALETALAARPPAEPIPATPELEPVPDAPDSLANAQSATDAAGAQTAAGPAETQAIDPLARREEPPADPAQVPAAAALPHETAPEVSTPTPPDSEPSPQPSAEVATREHAPSPQPAAAARRESIAVAPRAKLRASSPSVAVPKSNAAASSASKPNANLAQAAATTPPEPAPAAYPLALAPLTSAPRPTPPPAAKRTGAYSVELGDPVTSRRSVSKGALRGALNADALARCYRDAAPPLAEPTALHATLELTTDLSGRVRSAHLRGAKLEPELVQCVESHARRSRVREGDSSGAMQAAIALTFRAL